MHECRDKRHRVSGPRRDCASDPVADVDSLRIKVRIDNHSDAPSENWQEQLKRQRRRNGPHRDQSETPAPSGQRPPDALIDEYAAPF